MRLIDADALDSVVFRLNTEGAQITRSEYKLIANVIFEFPTIDAVGGNRMNKKGELMQRGKKMKAILVIDIGDEEIEDLAINYLLYRSSEGMVIDGDIGAVLKPMPQKYCTDADDIEEDSYWQGWNECIDAIVGETE